MVDDLRRTIASLRKGDELSVGDLSDLAIKVVDVLALLELIHGQGAYVVDAKGRRSDKDLVGMLSASMPKLRKGTTRRQAKANARKGAGRPREDENRMPKAEAAPIWHDVRIKTNDEALEQMWGWSPSAAHRYLGPSGRPKAGRPKKPPQKPKSKRR